MPFDAPADCMDADDADNAWPLLAALLSVDLLLVLLNIANMVVTGGVTNLVFLGAESSIPTWWSSMNLGLASLLLATVVLRSWYLSGIAGGVLLIALVLLAMSVDEIATLHERIGMLLDGATRRQSVFHYTGNWFAVLGIPVAAVIMVVLWRVRTALAAVPGTSSRLLVGFCLLFAGALVVEGLTNLVLPPELIEVRRQLAPYLLAVVVEEGLEMAGHSVLLWASFVFLLQHPSMAGVVEAFTRKDGGARDGMPPG